MNNFHFKLPLITLCIICCTKVSGQNIESVFFNNIVDTLVKIKVTSVKKNLFQIGSDTSSLDYLPVFNASLITSVTSNQALKAPLLSEVLLIKKSSNKIVGSAKFCADTGFFIAFEKRRHGIATVPCIWQNRLSYIPKKYYRKITKIINKDTFGCIIMISNTGSLYHLNKDLEWNFLFNRKQRW